MAVLTTKQKKSMPQSQFALPGKNFPIEDAQHGRKALQLDYNKTPAQRKTIEAKVHKKFPQIGKSK